MFSGDATGKVIRWDVNTAGNLAVTGPHHGNQVTTLNCFCCTLKTIVVFFSKLTQSSHFYKKGASYCDRWRVRHHYSNGRHCSLRQKGRASARLRDIDRHRRSVVIGCNILVLPLTLNPIVVGLPADLASRQGLTLVVTNTAIQLIKDKKVQQKHFSSRRFVFR
jgi:hypothetical protein